MELRKRLNPKIVFAIIYFACFLVFLIIGLRPADAINYDVSARLNIGDIGLSSDVTTLVLENNKLNTPDTIVGSYSQAENKTLLIGHSTTVFSELYRVELDDGIDYNNKDYKVEKIITLEKKDVKMSDILAEEEDDTLVLMTCAGDLLEGGDATHRLIIYASSE